MTTNLKLESVLDLLNPTLFKLLTTLPNRCFDRNRLERDNDFLEIAKSKLSQMDEFSAVAYKIVILFKRRPELMNRVVLELIRNSTVKVEKPLSDSQLYSNLSYSWRELEDYRKVQREVSSLIRETYFANDTPPPPEMMEKYLIMKHAGVGLSWDEGTSLAVIIKYLTFTVNHFSSIRFWGKIFGRCYDYYIIECELTQSEIEKRNNDRDNLKPVKPQEEKFRWSMNPSSSLCSKDLYKSMWAGGVDETAGRNYVRHPIDLRILELMDCNSKFDGFTYPELPAMSISPENMIPEENIGSGANKKVYLVSNDPTLGEWCELPIVQPHQISAARAIKHYFIGDLNAPVVSFPTFPGPEINLLRAQIARISAGTQISPVDYYSSPWGEEGPEEDVSVGLEAEELRLNTEYTPVPPTQLGDPKTGLQYWVHHTEHILKQGRTHYWAEAKDEDEEGIDEIQDEGQSIDPDMTGPKLLTKISKDEALNGIKPWFITRESKGFPSRATVVVRSLLWPGAVAWAKERYADNIYVGWGDKLDTSLVGEAEAYMLRPVAEYEVGPDVKEYHDPTVEETNRWITDRNIDEMEGYADEANEEEEHEDEPED